MSNTSVFPAEALVKSGSGICHNSPPSHACVVRILIPRGSVRKIRSATPTVRQCSPSFVSPTFGCSQILFVCPEAQSDVLTTFVRPKVLADFRFSGGKCCQIPAEALVNFGLHPAVLIAFPRKRCMIFVDSTFTASTTNCTTTRVGTMNSISSRSQR